MLNSLLNLLLRNGYYFILCQLKNNLFLYLVNIYALLLCFLKKNLCYYHNCQASTNSQTRSEQEKGAAPELTDISPLPVENQETEGI